MYRILLAVAVFSLAGCASLQMGNQGRVIDAPASVVFEATLSTLETYGFEIAEADAENGWIETTHRPVYGKGVPWDRTPEQVRADIERSGPERIRLTLLITFADDASDGPRKPNSTKKSGLLVKDINDRPVGQFVNASEAYDDLLDAIKSRAEAGR